MNINFPRSLLAVVSSFTLLALFLLVVLRNDAAQTGVRSVPASISQGESDVSKSTVSGTEDIPIYPGAVVLLAQNGEKPGSGTQFLSVRASGIQVSTFYKNELGRQGWQQIDEIATDNTLTTDFFRIYPEEIGGIRWYLRLALDIDQINTAVGASITFERWPDPNRVPIPPTAQLIGTKWIVDSETGSNELVSSYQTILSHDDIRSFFTNALDAQGWTLAEPTANPLLFSYSHSVLHATQTPVSSLGQRINRRARTGSLIQVLIKPVSHGETIVEVTVSGTEVKSASK